MTPESSTSENLSSFFLQLAWGPLPSPCGLSPCLLLTATKSTTPTSSLNALVCHLPSIQTNRAPRPLAPLSIFSRENCLSVRVRSCSFGPLRTTAENAAKKPVGRLPAALSVRFSH